MLILLIIVILLLAGGGGYYGYTRYLHVETVTTSIARLAPVSEAIYAEITRRYGASKLAELQAMLHVLEECLSDLNADQESALPGE